MTDWRLPTLRERNAGAVAHLSPIYGALVPVLGSVAVALLVWWRSGNSDFVERHAREAFNFQLTMVCCYGLGLAYLYVFALLGVVLLGATAAYETVVMYRAARWARAGRPYRYRLCCRFMRDT